MKYGVGLNQGYNKIRKQDLQAYTMRLAPTLLSHSGISLLIRMACRAPCLSTFLIRWCKLEAASYFRIRLVSQHCVVCHKVWCSFLFTIYLRLLGELIHHHEVRYHQYADDTQLYISAPGKLL